MKKIFIVLMTSFITHGAIAQTQQIKTNDGKLKITPVLHASMVLKWNDKTIFIDPYGGAEKYSAFGNPDLVIITDIHGDHLNMETLQALDVSSASFIVPQAVEDKMTLQNHGGITVLSNGDKSNWNGVEVEALPMYNLPDDATSRHKKGRGNGYVLTIGGKKLYISGDTEDIPEMRQLSGIDYAFVCMNLPYTMTVDAAADAVLEFQPATVYPFHYRGKEGKSDVKKFKSLVDAGNKNIKVVLLDWYPE